MKKYITTLIIAASAAIHAQAADLESQLSGYWQPDMPKTLALAKKQNREIDPLTAAFMGKMVFEFQNGKMTVHGPSGFTTDTPTSPYKLSAVDEAANSLMLSADGKEMKVRFDKGQLALNDPDTGWMIFNRMSKEDFAKREVGNAAPEDDSPAAGKTEDVSGQPISGDPAEGKVNGKEFKVEEATLEDGTLILSQGEGFPSNLEQFWIDLSGKNIEDLSGKSFTVQANERSGIEISLGYTTEKARQLKSESFFQNYTMALEFGTAKGGKIPGKINLRLPDEAGSFVVGSFEAEIK